MLSLKNCYPSLIKDMTLSYGGSQLWSDSAVIQKCGCGPVAAMDAAIYLSRFHGGGNRQLSSLPPDGPIPCSAYMSLLRRFCLRYFPIIPPLGINPMVLTVGLNRLFHDEKIPFKATVYMATEKIWAKIEEGLQSDTPVLLAIGQNYPRVWQKNRLAFYIKRSGGNYEAASGAKAHFVSITGMDETWLCISSWGNKYYINRTELTRFIRDNSRQWLCGIIYVQAKKCYKLW